MGYSNFLNWHYFGLFSVDKENYRHFIVEFATKLNLLRILVMLSFLWKDKTRFIYSGESNHFLAVRPDRLECGLFEILFGTFEIAEEYIDIVKNLISRIICTFREFFQVDEGHFTVQLGGQRMDLKQYNSVRQIKPHYIIQITKLNCLMTLLDFTSK